MTWKIAANDSEFKLNWCFLDGCGVGQRFAEVQVSEISFAKPVYSLRIIEMV